MGTQIFVFNCSLQNIIYTGGLVFFFLDNMKQISPLTIGAIRIKYLFNLKLRK